MQKIIVIIGPTAIGKSSIALGLAKKNYFEIISGDSMQIYKEVGIGTAKPTISEMTEIKHYLVNEKSIFDEYSVRDFVQEANKAINIIIDKNKIPLVVGGTGLYINALINKMQLGEPDKYKTSVDSIWEDFLEKNGPIDLWNQLNNKDPEAAKKIAPQNIRRTLRALSVISRTGKPFSSQQKKVEPRYDALIIGLNTDREIVYKRINDRVDLMMDNGLLKEAKLIYDNQDQIHQVKQAIGYKEFFPYFDGQMSLDECVQKLKQASRKYAKRQLTYFKHQFDVSWFDNIKGDNYQKKIESSIREFLKKH